jgi:hypothetical protein
VPRPILNSLANEALASDTITTVSPLSMFRLRQPEMSCKGLNSLFLARPLHMGRVFNRPNSRRPLLFRDNDRRVLGLYMRMHACNVASVRSRRFSDTPPEPTTSLPVIISRLGFVCTWHPSRGLVSETEAEINVH